LQFGDLERCVLRPGKVHSADGWEGVLKPVLARYRGKVSRVYFRADAGFANPDVYEFLEPSASSMRSISRPTASCKSGSDTCSSALSAARPTMSGDSTRTSPIRPESWTRPRLVVAKVEWHPGELYPRLGFVVTNMARPAENVVAFYNNRDACEQWIKEGKGAIKWTRLSCRIGKAPSVRTRLEKGSGTRT
jgi:hypothetical protein